MSPDTQEDLTHFDHLVVETDTVFAADDAIPQPLQDRFLIPATAVDENGDPT